MSPFKSTPYNHKIKALDKCIRQEFFSYLMEMGTGKTMTCIVDAALLYQQGKIDSMLIVAPKSVYRNWINEIDKHLVDSVDRYIVSWSASANKKEKELLESLLIIHEEKRLDILLMNVEAFSTPKGINFAQRYVRDKNVFIVIDESTTIKSPSAQRTKGLMKLKDQCKYRRIMTGSPITKNPLDLFSQFYFLNPQTLNQANWFTFRSRYARMVERPAVGGHRTYKHVVGYQRLEELKDKINPCSFRILKEDCLDLPEKVYMKRFVSLTNEQLVAYEQMRRYAISEINKGEQMTAASALAQLLRLHQITCGFMTLDDGSIQPLKNNRVKELMNMLEEITGKVIIWATYRHNIQEITKVIKEKYGDQYVESFYGGTQDTIRQTIVDDFQNPSSNLTYLVANPKTGGFGLNLFASSNMVYYSNSYDLEVRLQSEDRIHRIGQKNTCTYIDMISEGTVDDKIVKSLRNKINIASTIMGEDLKKWLI